MDQNLRIGWLNNGARAAVFGGLAFLTFAVTTQAADPGAPAVRQAMSTIGGLLVAAALLPRTIREGMFPAERMLADLLLAIPVGIAAMVLVAIARSRLAVWTDVQTNLTPLDMSKSAFVLVVLIGAIAEEIYFRGVLLKQLKDVWGAAVAVCASGFYFGLLHGIARGNIVLVLPFGLAGIFLGWVVVRRGGLTTALGAHVFWNATLALLSRFG